MSCTIELITPMIGGLVRTEKHDLLRPEVIEQIRAALEDRGVLVLPEINLTDAQQLAFTDALGERCSFTRRIPGADVSARDVYKITLDEKINAEPDYVLGTFFWHIDGITMDMALPKATVLSARSVSTKGGATEFSNLYAAYEALSLEEQRELNDLRVIHTIEASVRPVYGHPPQERVERWRAMAQPMEHPLVWRHADGRRSLLLGTHADGVVGWSGAHGRALLWRLQQWAAQPDFVYRHHWRTGDLVIWDNEGLMHRVIPYTDTGRVMHRTSIAGNERPGHIASAEAVTKLLEPVR